MLNTNQHVVDFLFKDLDPPCLVLGQENCDEPYDRNGHKIMKLGGGHCPQFLKVMQRVMCVCWGAVGVPVVEPMSHAHASFANNFAHPR